VPGAGAVTICWVRQRSIPEDTFEKCGPAAYQIGVKRVARGRIFALDPLSSHIVIAEKIAGTAWALRSVVMKAMNARMQGVRSEFVITALCKRCNRPIQRDVRLAQAPFV
jgi:hypothetical protein